MDDAQIVYAPADRVDQRLAEAQALGLRRIRVSSTGTSWLRTRARSRNRPAPIPRQTRAFYGPQVGPLRPHRALAAKHGLGRIFTLTASPCGRPARRSRDAATSRTRGPEAAEFKDLRRGRHRYSGTWQDETRAERRALLPPPRRRSALRAWTTGRSGTSHHGGWLTPQCTAARRGGPGAGLAANLPASWNAAWAGLAGLATPTTRSCSANRRAGCSRADGRSPSAPLHPRALLPERQARAVHRRGREARWMPGLVRRRRVRSAPTRPVWAKGWAHTRTALTTLTRAGIRTATTRRCRASAADADAGRRRHAYGRARSSRWMTYGFQIDPRIPRRRVLTRGGDWLDQALPGYRPADGSRQFLLVDDGRSRDTRPTTPHWGTFQSGLMPRR